MRIDPASVDLLSLSFLRRDKNTSVNGTIRPGATDTYNFGSAGRRWDTIYARTVIADTFTGSVSGNADTVDGFHASASPTANTLLALNASAIFPTSVYPSALLVDGSRNLTGNLAVSAGITIDGYDISELGDDFYAHESASNPHGITLEIARQADATVSGQITFNPPTSVPPFVLGVNAQDQTVVGLRADTLNQSVIAGTGLSGGGALTSDVTLNVGAGDGITVNADTVEINIGDGLAFVSNAVEPDWGTTDPTTIQPGDAADPGSLDKVARLDHTHQITTGTPETIVPGTSSEGTATSFSRSDHEHGIAVGSPETLSAGDSSAEGSSTSFSRADHQHGLPVGTPVTLVAGDGNSNGVATSVSRSDHKHEVQTAAPDANSVDLSTPSEGTGDYFARADHTHSLDQSIDPVWTGTHQFQTDIQVNANLDFIGGARSITTASGNLILAPANNVALASDISDQNWVSGTTAWGITTDGDADFRNIYADTVHTGAAVADVERVLAGSEVITKSVSSLVSEYTAGTDTTITVFDIPGVSGAVFTANDIVKLRVVSGTSVVEHWISVSNYVDNANGTQTWDVTYQYGVTTGTFPINTPVVDYGSTSDPYGFITLTAIDSEAPYIQVSDWTTNPWAGETAHVRLGYLNGVAEGGDEWGLWAKQGTDQYILLSDQHFEVHGMALTLYDSGTEAIYLDPSTPAFLLGNPLPTNFSTGAGVWMGNDSGTYKFRVGDPSAQQISWDGSALEVTGSLTAADGSVVIDNDAMTLTRYGYALRYENSGDSTGYILTEYTADRNFLQIFSGAEASEDELGNPSFETGDLTDWTASGTTGEYTASVISSIDPVRGLYAARLSVTSNALDLGNYVQIQSDYVDRSAGDVVYLTFWGRNYRIAGTGSYTSTAYVIFYDSGYSVLATNSDTWEQGSQWHNNILGPYTAPTNTAYVAVRFYLEASYGVGAQGAVDAVSIIQDPYSASIYIGDGKVRVIGDLSVEEDAYIKGTLNLRYLENNLSLSSPATGTITLDDGANTLSITTSGSIYTSGTTVSVLENLSVSGNITVTGTVDGVDIAGLESDVDDLETKLNDRAYQNIISMLMFLPGLRGLWASSIDESGDVIDLAGQGRTLTAAGSPNVGIDGVFPYLQFDGTFDYLYRADEAGLDISGTEAFVESSYQGLTAGGIFKFDDLSGTSNLGVMGKWLTTGNQRSWLLYLRDATTKLQAVASDDGTSTVMSIGSSKTLSTSNYYFCVFRFVPSTSLDLWVNDTKNSDTTGTLLSSLYNSSAQLNIMSYGDGYSSYRNQGRMVFSFLTATALSDAFISSLYDTCADVFSLS